MCDLSSKGDKDNKRRTGNEKDAKLSLHLSTANVNGYPGGCNRLSYIL